MKPTCGFGGLVLLVCAAVASAQEAKPPEKDRLVVRAKLKHAIDAPDMDQVPITLAFTHGPHEQFLFPEIHASGTDYEAVFSAPDLDVPGRVVVSPGAGGRSGVVVVFRESMKGELDLGELAFGDEAPVFVSGHVARADGKPAFGADVFVKIGRSTRGFISFGEMKAVTDAAGAFVIRGDVRGNVKGFEVETEGRWRVAKPVAFARGATDVKLVAEAMAGVTGTIELPEGLDYADLVVVMKGPPGATEHARTQIDESHWSGGGGTRDCIEFPARPTFSVSGLAPGVYDVRVRFRGASRPLLRLPEVKIDADTTELPRLVLKDVLHRIAVHVTAADGSPAKGARLLVRDKGDRGKFREIKLDAASSAQVAFASDEVELAARAEGAGFVLAVASGAETTLTPQAVSPTTVSVTVPDGTPRSSNDAKLWAVLEWRGPADRPRDAVEALWDDLDPRAGEKFEVAFPETGPAVLTVDLPGWYQVKLSARRPNGSVSRVFDTVLVSGPSPICVPIEFTGPGDESILDDPGIPFGPR